MGGLRVPCLSRWAADGMLATMSMLGPILVVAVGVALTGCSGPDAPAAEQGSTTPSARASVTAVSPLSSAPAPSAPIPSVPIRSVPASSAPASSVPLPPAPVPSAALRPPGPTTARPAPPVPSATTAPAPVTVSTQEAAYLAKLQGLSAHVADGQAAITLGHRVCTQFGEHVGYNQIADTITGYNPDDARNLITAAVLTLCPQYKSLAGG